ncbi:hypothetical protein pb186bvf_011609 [Paramecium bursaria]
MIQSTDNLNYQNARYTFTCVRRHIFKDKTYHVHVLNDVIAIGEQLNDPNPKYKLELRLKNQIYWKIENGIPKAFGIIFRKNIKYFDANPDHLTKFKSQISCQISFGVMEDQYKLEEQIGKGSFSTVYRIHRRHDNKLFALKYVNSKQKTDKENMQLVENEITILNSINNDLIIKIYEVYKIDEFNYGIVLEYSDGQCLASIIDQMKKNNSKLTGNDIKSIMHQLLRALAYLHADGIIHRDIKPQNIMIYSPQYKIKIIDFGLSIKNQQQYNRCGTPGYMAPEIVNMKKDQQKCWTDLCDVFSLGVVFFKLLSKGTSCFQGQTSEQVLASNKRCQIDWGQVQQHQAPPKALSLLKSMLEKDPEQRIKASEALKHAYFADLQLSTYTEVQVNSMTLKSRFMPQKSQILQDSFQNIEPSIEERHQVKSKTLKPSLISRLQL